MKHPSKAMERLIKSYNPSSSHHDPHPHGNQSTQSSDHHHNDALGASVDNRDLKRPVLAFVMQKHDLESLQLAMRQALRKAMCRVYALQVMRNIGPNATCPPFVIMH